jgi:uncharacterized protein (DUF885 family)
MGDIAVGAVMLDAFFESYYRLRPVNATFTGIHEHDHRLPDWSPDGLASAVDEMRTLRSALVSTRGPDVTLRDVAARDRELATAFLDVQIAEHESDHFQRGNPSLAIGEAVFATIALMTRPFAAVADRADAASARLTAVPVFLEGARRSLVAPVPDEWRIKCLRECDGADRLLRDGIGRWIALERIDDSSANRLKRAAERAGPAFESFRDWLERGAGPAANHGPADRLRQGYRGPPKLHATAEAGHDGQSRGGNHRYGCGAELFDLLLARGHWCERRRTTLAAEAKQALDEALEQLHARARAIAPGGWPEVQQRLMSAHPAPDDYLAAYQRAWDACRERAEAKDLVTWPDSPIRYVPIPIHSRDAAPFLYYLHYRSPAPFDRLPMHDYVVTPIEPDMPADEQLRRLRATNTSVIRLNHVVHHGAIGHHVQNYYAYAGASEIGRVAAVDCASRIAMFQGGTMAEGWACYATDLMDEVGFFTPEESLAQQHTRARLLARAVVDIGLHERSLSFDEGVALYQDRVGMSHEAARGEMCKNSMFPGTAVMYWLGTDALHQLRRERQRIDGASFSLRRFHDRVLAFGSIPVPLIAELMS